MQPSDDYSDHADVEEIEVGGFEEVNTEEGNNASSSSSTNETSSSSSQVLAEDLFAGIATEEVIVSNEEVLVEEEELGEVFFIGKYLTENLAFIGCSIAFLPSSQLQ